MQVIFIVISGRYEPLESGEMVCVDSAYTVVVWQLSACSCKSAWGTATTIPVIGYVLFILSVHGDSCACIVTSFPCNMRPLCVPCDMFHETCMY